MMVVLAGCMTQPQELGTQQSPPRQGSSADVVVRVQDIEVRPVAGAIVVLDNESTTTRIDGIAVFEDVPPGPHSLTASAPGFETLTQTFVSGDEIIELRLTLEPFRDSYELNYYYAEIACGAEAPCKGGSANFEGVATAPLGGFRNGTLRVEWKGGGTMSFAFEIRHDGAPLPFPDHRFALLFAGKSPLRVDVARAALSDPMRLGGVQYHLRILEAPADLEATHVLTGFAVRSEPGPQPRFPVLNETASAKLDFGEGGERTWGFTPEGSMGIIRIEATIHHECPIGTKAEPKILFTDPEGTRVEREVWPGEPDYLCGLAVAVPPFATTRNQNPLFLWDAAAWTAEVTGECTCSLELRLLEA